FDIIGAIGDTATYALLVGVLVWFSPLSGSKKLAVLAAATVWGMVIAAVAGGGGFAPGVIGPLPAPALPLVAFLALLFGSWLLSARFRSALQSVPMPVLVGLNVARIGGIFFLILAAQGGLSAPFAPSAGWGDIITGVLAIPLTIAVARSGDFPVALDLWNAFGALDLVAAISLGLLSAPGTPFRLFFEAPGTLAMSGFPWVMVPSLLVPLYLVIHLAIAAKLRSSPPITHAAVMAS
ncbi:MAG: hypothetical protein WBG26_00375, partial [Candidatus Binataceae bacterium]